MLHRALNLTSKQISSPGTTVSPEVSMQERNCISPKPNVLVDWVGNINKPCIISLLHASHKLYGILWSQVGVCGEDTYLKSDNNPVGVRRQRAPLLPSLLQPSLPLYYQCYHLLLPGHYTLTFSWCLLSSPPSRVPRKTWENNIDTAYTFIKYLSLTPSACFQHCL